MFFQALTNIVKVPLVLGKAVKDLAVYTNEYKINGLEDVLFENGFSCDEISKARALAVFASAAICQPYADVIGKKLDENDRRVLLQIGTLARVYDDLFDEEDLPFEVLENLIDGERRGLDNRKLSLYFDLYDDLKLRIGDNPLFYSILPKLHDAECMSNEQRGDLSNERLLEISEKKGGYSILLFYSTINPEMTELEQEAFYNGGAWVQLVDDLYDTRRDKEAGINTLAVDRTALLEAIENYQNNAFSIVNRLPYEEEKKERFFYRAFVCSLVGMSLIQSQLSSRKFTYLVSSFKDSLKVLVDYTPVNFA